MNDFEKATNYFCLTLFADDSSLTATLWERTRCNASEDKLNCQPFMNGYAQTD